MKLSSVPLSGARSKATTGTLCSSESERMRVAISADCTAEPPGEFTTMATALRLRRAKAVSSSGAMRIRDRP